MRSFAIVLPNGKERGVVTGRAPAAAACKAGSARLAERGGTTAHVRLRERGPNGKHFEYDVTRERKRSAVRARGVSFRYDIRARSRGARSRSARRASRR
jgi:hypothetical protein